MDSPLYRRLALVVAVLLIGILLLAPRMSPAGVWDVNASNPITIINHSPTIDYFPIENMFGSTSNHPTLGTRNVTIFADNSGNSGYVDYVEWRTSNPIDLPGFYLGANKDGATTNRMFTAFAIYFSEDSGSTWTKFYEKNVVNDYSGQDGAWLNLSVPSSSFIVPVIGKQYFRAEFVRGGNDPNVDGPRVTELDVWPSFNIIEVYSDNRSDLGWRLNTDLILNNPLSSTGNIAYSVDGGNSNTMSRVTIPFYQNTYLYDGNVTEQIGGSPADYNGRTFTWTVNDANDLSATATVSSGIRQVPLSTNFTTSGDPAHPTVSWHNSDPNLDYYVVRVIVGDLSGGWTWQTSLPYSSYGANPSYVIDAVTFEPGTDYWIRIEAREFLYLPFAGGSDIPSQSTYLQLMNRSTVVRHYWISEKGDLNGDHLVSIADAITALKVIAGVSVEKALWKNEINGDGRIGLEDATCVLQYIAGVRNSPFTDNDGDGYTGKQGDCDDSDPNKNPGAVEICGDGIDQDCDGSDLPCPPPCTNIAGYWDASDTVTITCCMYGECETDTFGGTDSIMILQTGCNISYDLYLSGYGAFTRTGTVDGNKVHVSGIFAVLQPGCTASQNTIDLNGAVNGDQINLQGAGIINGTCDGSVFQCTGTSTSTLTR